MKRDEIDVVLRMLGEGKTVRQIAGSLPSRGYGSVSGWMSRHVELLPMNRNRPTIGCSR